MLKKRVLFVCLAGILMMLAFTGCNNDSPPAPTAPATSTPPPQDDPLKDPWNDGPKVLTWEDPEGRRIISRAANLPDIAEDISLSEGDYGLDLEKSFVVTKGAGSGLVRATWLVLPSRHAPAIEAKIIVDIETMGIRIAGTLIMRDPGLPDAAFAPGESWITPRALASTVPDAERWSTEQWDQFFTCVWNRAAEAALACYISCGHFNQCTLVCVATAVIEAVLPCIEQVRASSVSAKEGQPQP